MKTNMRPDSTVLIPQARKGDGKSQDKAGSPTTPSSSCTNEKDKFTNRTLEVPQVL